MPTQPTTAPCIDTIPPGLPVVLVLASGRGERFVASGGQVHKLRALLAGVPVLQHTLAAVRASGLAWHLEDLGHPGMGDSIAAAVRATAGAAGWLVLPGDLPLVRPDTLQMLAQAVAKSAVTVPFFHGERGHPVGFGAQCLQDLLALSGEQGAASVVRQFAQQGQVQNLAVEDEGTVTDIDTVQDLERAQADRLYRLSLTDGQLSWHAADGRIAATSEPDVSWWQRLKLRLLSLFAVERLL